MIRINFTAEEQPSLQYERFHYPDPRIQVKMEALWLKSRGLDHAQKEAQHVIEQQTGIRREESQVRAFLHRLGMRCRQVGTVPGKLTEEQQAEQRRFLEEELRPKLDEAEALARQQLERAQVAEGRAKRRFDEVRELANTFMFEIHTAISDLPGSTPARELLVKTALTYLNSLAEESADDPELQRELAIAYGKVGDVQGSIRKASLGDTDAAAKSAPSMQCALFSRRTRRGDI